MSLKTNIEEIQIPSYGRKQDIFNVISHLLGLPLAVFIAIFGIVKFSNASISLKDLFGLLVFAVSALTVYLISSIYHGLKNVSFKKKIFRVFDHCAIYLLIAGTYTPVCVSMMDHTMLGLVMFIAEWAGAIIGMTLNAFFLKSKAARIISFILYIIMGWLCAFCFAWLYIPLHAFIYILIGGFVYTVGSILYALGHAHKNCHSIFHVFVLLGTIIQTIGVYLLY